MGARRSLVWVLIWFLLAMAFAWGVFRFGGPQRGLEFLTCYAIEWSLSLDNLFVFLLIFKSFRVSANRQLRALKWGIIGAVVLRLAFILIGVTLVGLFEPVLYLFGAFLIYSSYRMAFQVEGRRDIRDHPLVKFVRRRIPITRNYIGDHFWIRRQGKFIATPMLLVLVAIESSDLMFAVDSIPAAFAITRQPHIIFFANLFAILGLRSLYFLLARAEKMFGLLKYGVAVVLLFVGFKMLTIHLIEFDERISLGVVLLCLVGSLVLSAVTRKSHGLRTENGGSGPDTRP